MQKVNRIKIPELEDAPDIGYRPWSVDEKITVVTYYGVKETRAIAQYLKRPTSQVHHTIGRLGILFTSSQKERDEVIQKIKDGIL